MVDGAYAIDIVLRIADMIRKAHPGSPAAAYLNLKAALAAGDLVAALGQLRAMAEGASTLHVTALDDLGDAGVWVWQVLPKGRVATLLVANGHGLMALTTTYKINQNEPTALQQARDQVEPLLSVWTVN